MTQREKILASGLLTAVLVVGVGAVTYFFLVEPILDAKTQLDEADGELAKRQLELSAEEKQICEVSTVNPRLTLWQPPQMSGLVGDDGTMKGDACDAPNGSR